MKYWLDTEFIERPCTIDLISIAIVSEDGRELYCESLDFDESKASDWVKENVIRQLWSRQAAKRDANAWNQDGGRGGLMHNSEIAREIQLFVGENKPEFWGYYSDYDWVAFCWLFGSMIDLPKGWPMYCRDLKQLADSLGNPTLPSTGKGEHNALSDARWNRDAFNFLISYSNNVTAAVQSRGGWHFIKFEELSDSFVFEHDNGEIRLVSAAAAKAGTPVIDLDKNSWEAIKEAAVKSPWMPKGYMKNDWVSDVVKFLSEPQADTLTGTQSGRQFPMQGGPSIPWALGELLYAGYSARYGTQQSLERIAERGGFGWAEIELMWKNRVFREAIDAALRTSLLK